MSNTAIDLLESKIEKIVQSVRYNMADLRQLVAQVSDIEKRTTEALSVLTQLQEAVKKLAR